MTALGVTLLVVAVALAVAEAHLSTGGLVAGGAGLALVGGVGVLMAAAGAGAGLILAAVVVATTLISAAIVAARGRLARALGARPRTGREALVGHAGVVRSVHGAEVDVFLDASLWRAEPDPLTVPGELQEGDRVVVDRVNGLTLRVHRAEEWELNR